MSDYFVVYTNLASIPAVLYYQYHRNYYYSLQIFLVSFFSFIHHMKTSGIYRMEDSGLFSLLDGWYSYLTIYAFSIYLFLSNHAFLVTELSVMSPLLLSLSYLNIMTEISLPITISLILFIIVYHRDHFRTSLFYNPFTYFTFFFCAVDIVCFFVAIKTEYNYFHGIHHLFSFTVPIIIDKAITPYPPIERQN